MKIWIYHDSFFFFFFKNWTNQTKKHVLKIIPYFASAQCIGRYWYLFDAPHFLRWNQAQGRCPNTLGGLKMPLAPSAFLTMERLRRLTHLFLGGLKPVGGHSLDRKLRLLSTPVPTSSSLNRRITVYRQTRPTKVCSDKQYRRLWRICLGM